MTSLVFVKNATKALEMTRKLSNTLSSQKSQCDELEVRWWAMNIQIRSFVVICEP